MVLGKICRYYQDSKCLYKRTYCDLICDQMKHHGEDELESLVEKTSKRGKSNFTHPKKEDPAPFM